MMKHSHDENPMPPQYQAPVAGCQYPHPVEQSLYQPPVAQSQYQPQMAQTVPGDRPGGQVNCCNILLAFFLPPLAVLFRSGCGASFLINICLLCLGWIPGVIHAYYVLLRE